MTVSKDVALAALDVSQKAIEVAGATLGKRQASEMAAQDTAEKSLAAIGASRAALNAASDDEVSKAAGAAINSSLSGLETAGQLIELALPASGVGKPLDEWKECRSTIDRCDKLLVDLRKTGFGFVTAVLAASAYVFGTTGHVGNLAKSLLHGILVVLIIVLYLVDLAHQTWLNAAVERAKYLEEQELGYRLTRNISKEYAASQAVILGWALYVLLLVASAAIFWISIPLDAEAVFGPVRSNIYGASVVGLFVVSVAPLISQKRFGLAAWVVLLFCGAWRGAGLLGVLRPHWLLTAIAGALAVLAGGILVVKGVAWVRRRRNPTSQPA